MISRFKIKDNWHMTKLRLESEFVPDNLISGIITYLKRKGNYDLRLEEFVFNILDSLDYGADADAGAELTELIMMMLESVDLEGKTEREIREYFENLLADLNKLIQINFKK
ncbi:hypothetical protein KUK81_001755 [Vibrio parahaemolyticus]|uniref:hypothetical protein n=1 Tax=Vibrio parahaemolyticus TaxID=670 RepID=UPI0027E4AE1B|nr:hypothetical protein [Vibrio parahaemolyticus]EHR6434591.1 hypothetical protein [Vibrio parahaemolyticus]EHR6582641.1 hypothetical protein [Vibrio parahaemolyticus]WMN67041.1 hypothetical protein NI387_09390 [Vibrio parahaemolyticus]WMN67065.1 hypothetical protein NI387_09515 [Vibrio parahaemolyticus]HCG8572770.1 hypothetical protein [Vibrio parahaemolyticus]